SAIDPLVRSQPHSSLSSVRLTGLNKTVRLACVLGSLVRVSRRVGWRPTYSHHSLRKPLMRSTPMSTRYHSVFTSPKTAKRKMARYTRSEEHTSELQSRFDLVCR